MGIRDLWLAVSPVQQTRTLTEFGVREGFEPARRQDHCLRIGIDASIWMNQAQAAITYSGPGASLGENAALRVLFYRLCRLLALPLLPIFVFDGAERPLIKRGVKVQLKKEHGLKPGFTAFIQAFGFYCYTAFGEAEADLAELNKRDFVDAVMSEDSDVLVFGAKTVIRMENLSKAGDLVHIFDSRKIAVDPRVKLTHEGLFFMALLCGGDYDQKGLPGCGWRTALLLSQTKFAETLYIAASTSSSHENLREFLRGWREKFSTFLTTDPEGHLGRKYPSLAQQVKAGFPSIETVFLYAQPLTSWSHNAIMPDDSAWVLTDPDLSGIVSLSEKYFSWGSSAKKDIVERFKNNVWPGIAIHHFLALPSLYDQLVSYSENGRTPGGPFTATNILRIRQEKVGPGGPATHSNVTGYTIEISTSTLLHSMSLGLSQTIRSQITNSNITKALIWIPSSILSSVLPVVVRDFRHRKKLPELVATVYEPILQPLPKIKSRVRRVLPSSNEPESSTSSMLVMFFHKH